MSPSLEPGLLQNPELLETSMSTYYFVAASEAVSYTHLRAHET